MLGLALTAAAAVAAAGYQSMAPTRQWYGRTFTGLGRGSKQLALTFDDGPNDPHTLRLLEVLAKHNVHATFFLIGRYVSQRPDIVRELVRGGDVILLHDGSHRAFGADRAQTVIATDRLLSRNRSEGYEFVTIPEMMVPSQRKD